MISGLYLSIAKTFFMVISKNSQLGLMMNDLFVKKEFLELLGERLSYMINALQNAKSRVNESGELVSTVTFEDADEKYSDQLNNSILDEEYHKKMEHNKDVYIFDLLKESNIKNYLICNGVEKCSKMIRVGDNFSSRALSNIKFGIYNYLLGKNEMCIFWVGKGYIKGWYWNREKRIAFEYSFDLDSGKYLFDPKYPQEFIKIAKILTFVELGDIEVITLDKGRNNGKPKNGGKITNTSEYTVYVVDSSWNKLIIRTEGFAVMGHFRLQPCGINHVDRKLIWINAFEKHGYTRKPKSSILNN